MTIRLDPNLPSTCHGVYDGRLHSRIGPRAPAGGAAVRAAVRTGRVFGGPVSSRGPLRGPVVLRPVDGGGRFRRSPS